LAISKNKSSRAGNFGAIFHENPLYEFALDFVLLSSGEICPAKNMLITLVTYLTKITDINRCIFDW
jgi:hypothetical protein